MIVTEGLGFLDNVLRICEMTARRLGYTVTRLCVGVSFGQAANNCIMRYGPYTLFSKFFSQDFGNTQKIPLKLKFWY